MIRVALHNGSSLLSRAIKWQTRMPYSHSSLLLPDNSVIEAVAFKGVVHNDLFKNNATDNYIDIFSIPCTNTQRDIICEFALAQIGKPYDYLGALAFLTYEQQKRKQKGKFFCSELCYAAIAVKAQVPLFQKPVQPWQVAPGHLAWSPFALFRIRLKPKTDKLPTFI